MCVECDRRAVEAETMVVHCRDCRAAMDVIKPPAPIILGGLSAQRLLCDRCYDRALAGAEYQQRQNRESKIDWIIKAAGVPPDMAACTLDGLDKLEWPEWDSISEIVERVMRRACHAVLFYGGSGTGKTHAAIGIMRAALVQRKCQGLFISPARLNTDFHGDHFGAAALFTARMKESGVLLIDEYGSPDRITRDVIDPIVADRIANRRLTLLTTNMRLDQIDPKILSRLSDRGRAAVVDRTAARDYRQTVVPF